MSFSKASSNRYRSFHRNFLNQNEQLLRVCRRKMSYHLYPGTSVTSHRNGILLCWEAEETSKCKYIFALILTRPIFCVWLKSYGHVSRSYYICNELCTLHSKLWGYPLPTSIFGLRWMLNVLKWKLVVSETNVFELANNQNIEINSLLLVCATPYQTFCYYYS